MKKLITILFCVLSFFLYGQKIKGVSFDIEDFNKKFEIAEWLCAYDRVAWWTSDSVMTEDKAEIARLGHEWFCFQDKDDLWHAIYGKYENGNFDLVFHYLVYNSRKVIRVTDKVDTTLLNSYSRALIKAQDQIKKLKDTTNLRFNQYIRQNEDKSFTVWIFPAFQPDTTAIYGGEFIYTIDKAGSKILKDDSYFQGAFRGFTTDRPREIWLDYSDIEKPTLGGIFFVWYYKEYFTQIVLETSKSRSTLFQHEDKTYYWVHAEKEPEKKKRNK